MTITRAIRAAPVLADATAPESNPGFSVAAAGTWAFNEAPACRAVVATDADAAESAEAILLVRQLLRGRDGAAAAAACERALSAAASAEPAAAEVARALGALQALGAREDSIRRGAVCHVAAYGCAAHVITPHADSPTVARLVATLADHSDAIVSSEAAAQLRLALPPVGATLPAARRLVTLLGAILSSHLPRCGLAAPDGGEAPCSHASLSLSSFALVAADALSPRAPPTPPPPPTAARSVPLSRCARGRCRACPPTRRGAGSRALSWSSRRRASRTPAPAPAPLFVTLRDARTLSVRRSNAAVRRAAAERAAAAVAAPAAEAGAEKAKVRSKCGTQSGECGCRHRSRGWRCEAVEDVV